MHKLLKLFGAFPCTKSVFPLDLGEQSEPNASTGFTCIPDDIPVRDRAVGTATRRSSACMHALVSTQSTWQAAAATSSVDLWSHIYFLMIAQVHVR